MTSPPITPHTLTSNNNNSSVNNNNKRKRGSIQESSATITSSQLTPIAQLPPPLMPYHPGTPHVVSMVPVYHHHPSPYYISIASPPALHPLHHPSTSPSQQINNNNNDLKSNLTTSPRYERILPKRPSEASIPSPSPSGYTPLSPYPIPPPSSSSSHSNPPPQPSPLSLPQHYYPPPPPPPPLSSSSSSPHLQPSTADQREKARKISHSAIEKRRRERINDKIMQLKKIIPACEHQENLHKLSILQSAIDYITYLKNVVEEQQQNKKDHNNNNNNNSNSNSNKDLSTSLTSPSTSNSSSSSTSPSPNSSPKKSNKDHQIIYPDPTSLNNNSNHKIEKNNGGGKEEKKKKNDTCIIEPLKPIDIMKKNSTASTLCHTSAPPTPNGYSTSPPHPFSLKKSTHMNLDTILS